MSRCKFRTKRLFRFKAVVCFSYFIAQLGLPSSSVISNFVCCEWNPNWPLSLGSSGTVIGNGHADDLTFSGGKSPSPGFLEAVLQIVQDHGFPLNRRKTWIQKFTSRQTVTSIMSNQKPIVDCNY